MHDVPPDLDEPAGFTPWDRAAIASCVHAFPDYTVAFTEAGGISFACLRNGHAADAPEGLLTRQEGLTGFAATWPDGRQLRAGWNASLAFALSFIAQVLEDAAHVFTPSDTQDAEDRLRPT